jgi:hypothetical protein
MVLTHSLKPTLKRTLSDLSNLQKSRSISSWRVGRNMSQVRGSHLLFARVLLRVA